MKRFIRFLIGTTLSILCLASPLQSQEMPTSNAENPTDLFENYFWLNREIDIANCENTRVIEYLSDQNNIFYNNIYITTGETGTLYNGWGFDICEDNNDGSCITQNNLSVSGSEWNCGEVACSQISEICPNEEAYFRLDRYFYRGLLGANCEHDCDEVTKVDISPADFATLDGLTGIRFNPPTTTTYTITYTIGKDSGPIGGDCNNTDVPCTVQTRTRQVCVIVNDCGRCDKPITANELLVILDRNPMSPNRGEVVIEHFGPETGYFYELTNRCPYGTTIGDATNFNSAFYSCQGDLICFAGERSFGSSNLPVCSSNPYQLDLSKATSSKVIFEIGCDIEPVVYNICEGESIILGYNGNGITPNEAGLPNSYDCTQPSVTITPIGNPVQVENGFRVSPTSTAYYRVDVFHTNFACPPRSYEYLVQVDDTCDEVLTADNLPNRFPWLSNVVDLNNCGGTSIEVYQQSIFYYLLITTPTTTTLYFQDGTFYCQNANNLDCKVAYGFVNPIVTWTCNSGSFSNNSSNFRFSNNQSSNQFSVSPNPTTGQINLNIPVSQADFSTIRVFSSLGKLVKIEKIKTSNTITNLEMDLTTFDKGVYFIEYTTNNIATTKKVVVK